MSFNNYCHLDKKNLTVLICENELKFMHKEGTKMMVHIFLAANLSMEEPQHQHACPK